MLKRIFLITCIACLLSCKKDAPGADGMSFSANAGKPFTVTVMITNNDGTVTTTFDSKQDLTSAYSFVKDYIASKSKVYVDVYTNANEKIDGTLKIKGKVVEPTNTSLDDPQVHQSVKSWAITVP